MMNPEEAKERIIVALDCDEPTARSLARKLKGEAKWLKVGMTLYYQAGPQLVKDLREEGFSIFLDLKLCDIPHQVRGAARAAMASGADILSVHALGGPKMLTAALEGAKEACADGKIIAITILTSIDQKTLGNIGIEGQISDEAKRLALLATEAGCDGVVCSGQEARELRSLVGKGPLIVTPGIRMQDCALEDQARIMTPGKAIKDGASYLVIGRPITQAYDPVRAFKEAVNDIVTSA